MWLEIALAIAVVACGPPPRAPEPRAARLWLGGDVFLGPGGHHALARVAELTGGAPGIVNLEGPVGPGGAITSTGEVRLHNDAASLAELRAAGVVVAGIANNHAGDAGPDGDVATARALAAVGIQAAGGRSGATVVAIGGLRVVITAHDLEGGVPATLASDLAAARRRGDILVATFHVTGPPSYLPRPELVAAVAIAIDAGAQVVAAQGTHELARVERRGRTVIVWGLGNLAFACACTDEDSGALVSIALDASGAGLATVIPIDAALGDGSVHASSDPALAFELLDALGSTHLERHGATASF